MSEGAARADESSRGCGGGVGDRGCELPVLELLGVFGEISSGVVFEVSAQRGLPGARTRRRDLHDASPGEIRRLLAYRTRWYGSGLVPPRSMLLCARSRISGLCAVAGDAEGARLGFRSSGVKKGDPNSPPARRRELGTSPRGLRRSTPRASPVAATRSGGSGDKDMRRAERPNSAGAAETLRRTLVSTNT